jgi:hypothetical protein
VSVSTRTLTPQGNPGTVTAVACPTTGVRYISSRRAVNRHGVATVTFSGALTGVTYDLIKF